MDLWFTERYKAAGFTAKITETLYSGQSEFQKLDVVTTEQYGRMLLLDGLVMTTEVDEFIYHEMISHVPLLSLKNPATSVLVIGGGDGGTIREVLRHPSVQRAVLCEIDGEVIEVCKRYLPTIAGALEAPENQHRLEIEVKDGVDYLANVPPASFDLIIIDSTDPMGPGVGLFTVPFYQSVARALKPGGIMTAQAESPNVEAEGVGLIFANLRQVFKQTHAYWGVIPTYPGSFWTWAFCSQEVAPLEHVSPEKAEAIAKDCRYYNYGVHQGAFALPNFIKEVVEGSALKELALSER